MRPASDVPRRLWIRTVPSLLVVAAFALLFTVPATQAVQTQSPEFGKVTCVAFHPNNRMIAICGHDKLVRLWDYTVPRELGVLRGHSENLQTIAFSPDGKFLASGGSGKQLRVWDIRDPKNAKEVARLEGHTDDLLGVAFSSNSRLVASCGSDNTVRIWDIAGLQGGGGKANDGGLLSGVVGSKGSMKGAGGRLTPKFTLNGHTDKVWSVAFSKDDKVLASGSSDETLRLWDMTKSPPVQLAAPHEHSSSILSLSISVDGKSIATGALDQKVILWDVSNPRQPTVKQTMHKHERGVYTVSISPNGQFVASGSSDQKVHVWDVSGDSPTLIANQAGHGESVECVIFSPDGKTLASGSNDRTVRLWKVVGDSVSLKHKLPDAGGGD